MSVAKSPAAFRLSHRAVTSTIRGSYRRKSLSVHDGLKLAEARASKYSLPLLVTMMLSISGGKLEQIEASDNTCSSAQEQFTAMFSWAKSAKFHKYLSQSPRKFLEA